MGAVASAHIDGKGVSASVPIKGTVRVNFTATTAAAALFIILIGTMSGLHNTDRTWLDASASTPPPVGFTNTLYTYAHAMPVSWHAFAPGGILITLAVLTFLLFAVSVRAWFTSTVHRNMSGVWDALETITIVLLAVAVNYWAGMRDVLDLCLTVVLGLVGSLLWVYIRHRHMGGKPTMIPYELATPAIATQLAPWILALVNMAYYNEAVHNKDGAEDSALRDWHDNPELALIQGAVYSASSIMILRILIPLSIRFFSNVVKAHADERGVSVQLNADIGGGSLNTRTVEFRKSGLTSLHTVAAAVFLGAVVAVSIELGLHKFNHFVPFVYRVGNEYMAPRLNHEINLAWVVWTIAVWNFAGHTFAAFVRYAEDSINITGMLRVHGFLFAGNLALVTFIVSCMAGGNDAISLTLGCSTVFGCVILAAFIKLSHKSGMARTVASVVVMLGYFVFISIFIRMYDEHSMLANCASGIDAPNGDFLLRRDGILAALALTILRFGFITNSVSAFKIAPETGKSSASNVYLITAVDILFSAGTIFVFIYGNLFLTKESALQYVAQVNEL